MKTMNATDAKNRFGELLDSAQAAPVAILKNGRDVAYVISKEEFDRTSAPRTNDKVRASLEKSIRKWPEVYETLAR